MCVYCQDQCCKTECIQKLEERLSSIYKRLLSSFASTKQVIDVEVLKQSRMMCKRRSSLIKKLEAQFKEDVQLVQRLTGLLDYVKSRNNSDRNDVIAYIENQLNNQLGINNGNFSFNCNSSKLRDAILCFGEIERNGSANELSSISHYLFADKPLSSWLYKPQSLIGDSHDVEVQSLFSELESFEILDYTPTTSRTCSMCACEKADKPTAITCKQSTESITSPSADLDLFPSVLKDKNAWFPKTQSGELQDIAVKDIECKLQSLAIKQENDKPTMDIESPFPVAESSCKSAVSDKVCKFFGNCTFQGLNDATTVPIKPCVRTWLKSHGGFEQFEESVSVGFRGVESSDVINHLRKIGATDSAMWLAGKRSSAMASDQSSERILMPTNQLRGDNLYETWLQDSREQAGSQPNTSEMDIQAVKRSKLANFLLDSQQNFEADLEAILYRSPFAVRTTANWLQPTNTNHRKAIGAA